MVSKKIKTFLLNYIKYYAKKGLIKLCHLEVFNMTFNYSFKYITPDLYLYIII